MAGRIKHLVASRMCKNWWEARLVDLEKPDKQIATSKSSSEIGSDEDCCYPPDEGINSALMDIDLELDAPTWNRMEETELRNSELEDTDFTSSPLGLDLHSESVDSINAPESSISVEEYSGAAAIIEEHTRNLYTQIWEDDKFYESRKLGGPYYPFSGSVEWEVAEWLHSLDVPMDKLNHFFELEYVSKELTSWIAILTFVF